MLKIQQNKNKTVRSSDHKRMVDLLILIRMGDTWWLKKNGAQWWDFKTTENKQKQSWWLRVGWCVASRVWWLIKKSSW